MNLPWIGVQHWKTPAFFHWRVPYDTLRALVPPPFELDTFNNETWVSVVPFQATKTYPRVGRQFFSLGPLWQLNVRTYIRFNGVPGVYFLNIYTNSKLSRIGARTLLSLPYEDAHFATHSNKETASCFMTLPKVSNEAQFYMNVKPTSQLYYPNQDSLAYWLTERYHFYGIKGKRIIQASISHSPWQLQTADYSFNFQELDPIIPRNKEPLVHLAASQKTYLYPFKVKGIYLR